ncbi:MAG: hypothetical protein DPW14_03885 [Planctomycetes bacterium]|nr:hypothetical protein [Planctomycetota bacterium]
MDSAGQLDVAFILGAGASVEAGVPAVSDFVTQFRNHLEQQSDRLKTVLVKCLDDLIDAMKHPRNPPKQVSENDEGTKPPPGIQVNLETLYQVLFHNNRMPGLYATGLDVPERCRAMKGRPFELLEFELKKYVQYRCSRVRVSQLRYLLPLLSFVRPGKWLDVFTLNYDLCIEAICSAKGVVCETGFGPGEEHELSSTKWAPERFALDAPADGAVRLFKLHGSVSWLEPQPGRFEARSIETAGPARTIRLLGHTGANEGMLIYPALLKHVGAPPFLDLFHAFWERLKRLDLLFACGFSFSGDDHVASLVARGMQQNQRLTLALVDLKADDVRRQLLKRKDFAPLAARVVIVRRDVEGEPRQAMSAILKDGWLQTWSPKTDEFLPQTRTRALEPGLKPIELPGNCRRPISLCMDATETVYLACEAQNGHAIYRAEIREQAPKWDLVTSAIRTPRDILFDSAHNALLVVSGSYFRAGSPVNSLLRTPSDGFGRLWTVDVSNRRVRHVTGLGVADWFSFWKAYTSSDPFKIDSLLWNRSLGMLRWSSRMALEPGGESVLAVEARRLSRVDLRSGRVESLWDNVLDSNALFNLCDIAASETEGIYWLLEGGVANISRHPRVWRLNVNTGELEEVDLNDLPSEGSEPGGANNGKAAKEISQIFRIGSNRQGQLLVLLPENSGTVLKKTEWTSGGLANVRELPFRATHFCRSPDAKTFAFLTEL